MKLIHKVIITSSFAVVLGSGTYELQQRAFLEERVKTAQENEKEIVAELRSLETATRQTLQQLAEITGSNMELRKEAGEIHQLRAKVTLLRNQMTQEDTGTEGRLKALLARAEALKDLPRRFPEFAIPELATLDEEAWMELAKSFLVESMDDNVAARRVFKEVRRRAKLSFGSRLHRALRNYLSHSKTGLLPERVLELKSYFEEPIDDSLLRRYEVLHTGSVESLSQYPGVILLGERAPVDPEYDTRLVFISTNRIRTDDIYETTFPWDPAKGRYATQDLKE